ncbi:MAG: serine/threonine protein kinase [Rubrivivax sp.]|nr:serine/threonine protein kinase [Rubrivivax sp.]
MNGPLAPGQRLAGYRIERLLAQGGQGALYAAIEEASGEWRALKVLTPGLGADPEERDEAARRFEREAQAAARLQHPDIVRIHQTGSEAGVAYLVMDLLHGCDLVRYTRPGRLLPEPVVLRLAERIARALAHAHARGVVHRDLKPANVMVDWAADRVTLTDFGLARLADAERTRTGLVLGSPVYMAPELLAGEAASARSDQYALGVLLYQLLTGELPFDALQLGELLRQVAQQAPLPLQAHRPDLPSDLLAPLQALIGELLAKRAADRPTDGDALAARLAGLQGPPSGR